jgi:hypothetical protein
MARQAPRRNTRPRRSRWEIHVKEATRRAIVIDVVARHAGKPPSLYTYKTPNHVELYTSGRTFSGYDHEEGYRFDGSISDQGVQLYDHGEDRQFTYSLNPTLDLLGDLVYLAIRNRTRALIIAIAILLVLMFLLYRL